MWVICQCLLQKKSMNCYNYLRPKNIECILKIRIYASFKTSDSECICFTSLHNLTSQHLHPCYKNTRVNVFEVWKDLPSTLHNYVTSSRVKRLACCCNENANPNSQNTLLPRFTQFRKKVFFNRHGFWYWVERTNMYLTGRV